MKTPRIVIAGTQSGVGKTTIAVGLMAALTRRSYCVQPYKVGPDYIDPGFHTLVTGNNSRNLDSFFLGEEGIKEAFLKSVSRADISIIEGVMGLFDGEGRQGVSSTAHIAKTLKSPVILIIDAKKMAQSGAAIAYGYKNYAPQLNVRGVILNNIAGEGHYQMLKEPIEKDVGLEVLGYLPRVTDLELPERHLGLVPTTESRELNVFVNKLVELIEEYIDLEHIIELAGATPELNCYKGEIFQDRKKFDVKLGVAYDRAFNFYYHDNFDILKQMGAKIRYFSPVEDQKLPDVDGIYIGGGFPESFLEQLAKNRKMKEGIYQAVRSGLPVYAECGGLMYLTEEISDFAGNKYSMAGVIPGRVVMKDSLQAMGYVRAEAVADNLLLKTGETVRGHEFHYSQLLEIDSGNSAYRLNGGKGRDSRLEGYTEGNLLASYVHLHFGTKPEIAERFLARCQAVKLHSA